MSLYVVEPEVAGGLGENTVYKNYDDVVNNGARPVISHLHFVFDGWLGDDILETTPCFFVSERLKAKIEKARLTGCVFEDIEVSLSEEFKDLYPNVELPSFYRLLPQGMINIKDNSYTDWDSMDFSVSQNAYLVITERAKDVLSSCNMEYADIIELYESKI